MIIEEHNSDDKHLQINSQSGLILFSSGSTGKPKAMIHNFDNLVEHYKEKSLNMILFLMFDHIGGYIAKYFINGCNNDNPRNADDVNFYKIIKLWFYLQVQLF